MVVVTEILAAELGLGAVHLAPMDQAMADRLAQRT